MRKRTVLLAIGVVLVAGGVGGYFYAKSWGEDAVRVRLDKLVAEAAVALDIEYGAVEARPLAGAATVENLRFTWPSGRVVVRQVEISGVAGERGAFPRKATVRFEGIDLRRAIGMERSRGRLGAGPLGGALLSAVGDALDGDKLRLTVSYAFDPEARRLKLEIALALAGIGDLALRVDIGHLPELPPIAELTDQRRLAQLLMRSAAAPVQVLIHGFSLSWHDRGAIRTVLTSLSRQEGLPPRRLMLTLKDRLRDYEAELGAERALEKRVVSGYLAFVEGRARFEIVAAPESPVSIGRLVRAEGDQGEIDKALRLTVSADGEGAWGPFALGPAEEKAERVAMLLEQAQADFDAGRLIGGADGGALAKYRRVLELDPESAAAKAGIRAIAAYYHDLAQAQFRSGNDREALELAEKASAADPALPGLKAMLETLRERVGVGRVFRDCPECPEMAVIPAGTFTMGSPESEKGRSDSEGPRRRVTIARPFALGKHEVTFAEYDACVSAGGCSYRPSDNNWGRDNRPVIYVSWNDAKAYVAWLSRKTGKAYRLPSEAEWEYAARAGTTTPFSTGETISTDQANYDGNVVYGGGIKGVYRGRTTPVGTFPPNRFGLHDMHGNVWEWVEDCWIDHYHGAPNDERPRLVGDCGLRVVRGGSWFSVPWFLRSAYRYRDVTGDRGLIFGFRVARDL